MEVAGTFHNFIFDRTISRVGFRSGLIAFIAITAFGIVQVIQVLGILSYPFDEILIYGFSLCITIPFILEILALHHLAKPDKKFWRHAALIFTVICVVFVSAYYLHSLTIPLIMFVYFYPNYSNKLLLSAAPWVITAALSMLMLCLMFRKISIQKN